MIHPKKRKNTRREEVPQMQPEALVSLALELAPLSGLVRWIPYAQRLEQLRSALHGVDGMTGPEVLLLRRWANRWNSIDSKVREFYEQHSHQDRNASTARWRILEGGGRLEGWQYGPLKRLWIDHFGREPSIEIVPINQERTS